MCAMSDWDIMHDIRMDHIAPGDGTRDQMWFCCPCGFFEQAVGYELTDDIAEAVRFQHSKFLFDKEVSS